MGIMDEILKSDMSLFLDPDYGFGEQITYTPFNTATQTAECPITIFAVVIRNKPNFPFDTNSPKTSFDNITIYISRVDVPVINVRGDKISLRLRQGDTENTTCNVTKIITQDAGCFYLSIAGSNV